VGKVATADLTRAAAIYSQPDAENGS